MRFLFIYSLSILLFISSCEINNKNLSHYEFSRLCKDDLQKKYPEYKFSIDTNNLIVATKGIETNVINNYEHYLLYNDSKDSLNYFINSFSKLVNDIYMKKIKLDFNNIFPLFCGYDDFKSSLQFDANNINNSMKDYNNSLVIIYYKLGTNALNYIKQNEIDSLNITSDSLFHLAINNYRKKGIDYNIKSDNGIYIVKNNFFESSLLLLDEIWTKENFPIKGEIIISIPNDNILMVTGSDEKENLNKMWQLTQESYNKKSYRVSPLFFIRKNNKFEVYYHY